jgi:hypothetical protein
MPCLAFAAIGDNRSDHEKLPRNEKLRGDDPREKEIS